MSRSAWCSKAIQADGIAVDAEAGCRQDSDSSRAALAADGTAADAAWLADRAGDGTTAGEGEGRLALARRSSRRCARRRSALTARYLRFQLSRLLRKDQTRA